MMAEGLKAQGKSMRASLASVSAAKAYLQVDRPALAIEQLKPEKLGAAAPDVLKAAASLRSAAEQVDRFEKAKGEQKEQAYRGLLKLLKDGKLDTKFFDGVVRDLTLKAESGALRERKRGEAKRWRDRSKNVTLRWKLRELPRSTKIKFERLRNKVKRRTPDKDGRE